MDSVAASLAKVTPANPKDKEALDIVTKERRWGCDYAMPKADSSG